ncbi:MAG: hypothetical protein K6E63_10370 [Lachnospiraceae bacterium]|nr:hypothetical protein [Lachnospiraceae bacterium]
MKKRIAVVIATVAALCLTACEGIEGLKGIEGLEGLSSLEGIESLNNIEGLENFSTDVNININRNDNSEELYSSSPKVSDSPEWVGKLAAAQDEDVKQLFIVAGMGVDKTTATVSMHERDDNGNWLQVVSTPGFVGKNGLCPDEEHKEGCAQTPIGTYRFNKAFGIADDPGCAIDYVKVDDDTYWSGDDREGMNYNEMVDIKDFPDLDMENSEHIVDYNYQYQYCLNISFNEEGTPGRGSAIFLHCFGPEKPYTGGCVAIPENIMKIVMRKVRPDCVVVIDTMDNLTAAADDAAIEEAADEADEGDDAAVEKTADEDGEEDDAETTETEESEDTKL